MMQIPIPQNAILHSMLFAGAFAWQVCFCIMAAAHAMKLRRREPVFLLLFGACNSVFTLCLSISYTINFQYLFLLAIGVDFLIIGMFFFDLLYNDLFFEGLKYKWSLNKYSLAFVIVSFAGNPLAITYDLNKSTALLGVIPAFASVGLGIVMYLYVKMRNQFKNLYEYILKEEKNADREELWKIRILKKQYKFLELSFHLSPISFFLNIIAFIIYVFVNLEYFSSTIMDISLFLLLLSISFQILGFFYPMPAWKELVDNIK
ncbi:MAG: hypothetical protein ACTSUE_21895 [Promethearchaeota archaeon]